MFHVKHILKTLIFSVSRETKKYYPQFTFAKFLLWITFDEIGIAVYFDSYPQIDFCDD